MSDFKKKLDELASAKVAAELEAKRAEDEKRAKEKQWQDAVEAKLAEAFDPVLRDLEEKLPDLGLARTQMDRSYGVGIWLVPVDGIRLTSHLMVLPRSEAEGVEAIRSIRNKPSQSQKFHPDVITQAWAEKLVLEFLKAILA